jgi:hypothetical protein
VCKLRLNLLEHAQVLAADACLIHRQARKIAVRMCQAADQALCDGVGDADEHDRNRLRSALERDRHRNRKCDDHVGLQGEELPCEFRRPSAGRRKSIIDTDIAAFRPT